MIEEKIEKYHGALDEAYILLNGPLDRHASEKDFPIFDDFYNQQIVTLDLSQKTSFPDNFKMAENEARQINGANFSAFSDFLKPYKNDNFRNCAWHIYAIANGLISMARIASVRYQKGSGLNEFNPCTRDFLDSPHKDDLNAQYAAGRIHSFHTPVSMSGSESKKYVLNGLAYICDNFKTAASISFPDNKDLLQNLENQFESIIHVRDTWQEVCNIGIQEFNLPKPDLSKNKNGCHYNK